MRGFHPQPFNGTPQPMTLIFFSLVSLFPPELLMTLLWCVLSKTFEKKDNVISISVLKPNFFRIYFPSADTRNDILSRGPWTIKDSWLALAPFDPSLNIDEYSFNSMNIWVCIYSIPSVFIDDDNIVHQIRHSLGAMIGKVTKIDTRRIDLNMVDYLRVGIILDVTKPIRRCATIGACKADASTNEDTDNAVAAAEEDFTLPATPNGSPVTLHANGNATTLLATTPTKNATIKTSSILDNNMATNKTIPPTQAFRGNKRRSSMPDTSMTKRPHPPPLSNVKAGMRSRKNSPVEVEI
ncbi:hypothetical protein V6N12_037921 [Hibiscus sabdariffa]|uniref:DUF4283 domain-containing protein n=1 Tax=Hibiscus sabdariffa TaxID=183260 RepID=A0ABR2B0S3_9ROSI